MRGTVVGPDQRVASFAARRRGLIHVTELRACGLTNDAIAHRVATGRLHPKHRGVYAVGHPELPPLGRETAALLACGEGAVLSDPSAAVVWELLKSWSGDVEVSVPRHRNPRHDGIRVHRRTSLPPSDIRIHKGLAVTSPARTLIDLAPALSIAELERMVADAFARGLIRRGELERRGRLPPALRAVLQAGPRRTRSDPERLLLGLVRRAGLPVPEMNVEVAGWNVDAFWPAHRLILEVDAPSTHAHPVALERDRRKDAALRRAGFDLVRVTKLQLETEPERVVADLAGDLARAA